MANQEILFQKKTARFLILMKKRRPFKLVCTVRDFISAFFFSLRTNLIRFLHSCVTLQPPLLHYSVISQSTRAYMRRVVFSKSFLTISKNANSSKLEQTSEIILAETQDL